MRSHRYARYAKALCVAVSFVVAVVVVVIREALRGRIARW